MTSFAMSRARKLASFPDEDKLRKDIPELEQYAALNPEFALPRSERAGKMLLGIYSEKGEPVSESEADRRREAFRQRLMSVIGQLEKNPYWKNRLEAAKDKYPERPLEEVEQMTSAQIDRLMSVTAAANDAEFSASARTFLKTLQEILTAPTERIAFQRDDLEGDAVDLSRLVIDPAMITPTLLDNLGLSQYRGRKGSSKADKVESYAQAVPAIRGMISSLEPFKLTREGSRSKLHYFRLMRIGAGEHEGELLGTQTINKKKVLFRTDLHGAYRRIDHIDDQYSAEVQQLQTIVDKIREIDGKIAKRWDEIKGTEELDKIKAELIGMVDELTFVHNDHKKKILDLISKCTGFTVQQTVKAKFGPGPEGKRVMKEPATTKEVVNPGAMRAQWNTVDRHVDSRIHEIAIIRRYLAEDQAYIKTYMGSQSRPFDRFFGTVEKMHGDFKILDEDRPLSHGDAAKIRHNLLILQQELEAYEMPGFNFGQGVQFEPYLTFARRMMQHIEATCAHLREEDITSVDRKAAATDFMKVYVVTKIQRVYSEVQKFFDDCFSGNQPPSFAMMENSISNFYLLAANKNVDERFGGKKVETKEYNDLFGEIYHLCHSLRKKARQGKELDAKAEGYENLKAKIHEAMRAQIKGFDFKELMHKYFGESEAPSKGHSAVAQVAGTKKTTTEE
jgi:hypothetical protein